MPLIKKIEKNNYQIGIWEMSESLEHLYLLNSKLDISDIDTSFFSLL